MKSISEDQLKQKEEEKNDDVVFLKQLNKLNVEYRSLSVEQRRLTALKDELSTLKDKFTSGKYFAHLSDYWKIKEVDVEGHHFYKNVKWEDFQRTEDEVKSIQVRTYIRNDGLNTDNPYKITRKGAMDMAKGIPPASSARTSPSSQGVPEIKDKIWPTDIFGNKTSGQISHLLPAGPVHHMEWMEVAAAVVGIGSEAGTEIILTKAVRGCTESNDQVKRKTGTGVVHFVSNKLRMAEQRTYFDGEYPSALLIPVMKLSDAKSWSGKPYSALFVMGLPLGDIAPQNDPENYNKVLLSTVSAMNGGVIQDATIGQIEQARTTLIDAVLALRSLVAKMDDARLSIPGQDSLYQAHVKAKETHCYLPRDVHGSIDKKPLCLMKFGEPLEEGKHPPPDPLLLAYKAAVIWAKMTDKFRLLANGEKPDSDDDTSDDDMSEEVMSEEVMSEEDCIAEVAIFDDRNRGGNSKQQWWEEDSRWFGTTYGYQG